MSTAYSTLLKLALPTQGELSGTWGTVINENITNMVEEAVAGLKTINTWSGDAATLSTANGTTAEARAAILNLTDTGTSLSGAANLVCPTLTKTYLVKNGTAQTVTLKTSGGTGIAVPTGKSMWLYCDGTNVVEGVNHVAGALTVAGAITGSSTLQGTTITATTAVVPDASGGADLGTTSLEWGDIFIADDKKIKFGSGQDVSMEYDEDGTDTLLITGDVTIADGTNDFDIASHDGSNGLKLGGTLVASTAAELNIMDGGTVASSVTLADADRIVVNDDGTMKQVALTDFETYFESVLDTLSVTSVGALDSGSITSGFGSIDTGSSTITTTGAITGGSLTADDVAINGKVITMTGSASDTAVFTAGTDGTLSIVTTDAAAAAANIQITADGTVDIDSVGVLTLDSGAAINIEPASGSAILLDGTISIDAGVVTGATSITSTAFVGDITGDVTGNTSGTAATVTGAAQTNITSLGTLTALTVDDVAVDGKVITMTGSTSDTAVFTAGTDGTLSIVTTDDAAAAANITITADGTFEADGTTITLDSSGDIDLNAAGGDVFFKADSTTFGSATNTSGDLIIKSGTTTALTFSGANVTAAGTIGSGAITSTGTVTATGFTIGSAAITEAELEILDGAGVTTAELNLLDGSAKSTSSITLADTDALIVIDGSTTKQIPASDITAYTSGDATALAIALG